MLSKLSVKQMNLPESEKCDWKSCSITWTTAKSKWDKTTHNPKAGVWIIYLTVSTSINSRMNVKTHRIWPVATQASDALNRWKRQKKYSSNRGVVTIKNYISFGANWGNVPQIKFVILCTQHWPSSRSNHQTSSEMCSGTLCRAQSGKFRLIFWSLMWVPFHKFTVLHAFMISFIYATSSGSRSAGTLLLIRIILLLFFVNNAGWNIQLHPLFPNTWVHDFPRRIQSVIHTTAKRHVNHDHITSLLNLNVTLFLPLADGPRELSNYQ